MLQYLNRCPFVVSVAFMRYTPGCPDGGDWTKEGWWNIPPGGTAIPYDDDLDDVNAWWCDFITGGGLVWPGSGIIRALPLRAFDWCEWTASSDSFDADMFLFNVDDNEDQIFDIVP
jgi:hypothetical protein